MGLRDRLNQLQGRANALMTKASWTLDDAKELLALGMELIAAIKDGVKAGIVVEDNFITKLGAMVLTGEGGYVPISVVLDLDYSNLPKARSKLVGGPYDGKSYDMNEEQMLTKILVLKDKDGDLIPETYVWNGYVYEHQGTLSVSTAPKIDT